MQGERERECGRHMSVCNAQGHVEATNAVQVSPCPAPPPPTSLGGRVEVARKSHYRRLLRPCPCLFVCGLLRRRVAWCITSHWRLKDNVVVEFVLHTCVGSGL